MSLSLSLTHSHTLPPPLLHHPQNENKNIYKRRYLKVELDDPIHGPRYRAVFKLFQERASRSYATSTPPPTTTTPTQTRHTPSHLHRTPSRTPSVWDILTTQDSFLTGVTDCQAKSGYGPRW